MHFANIKVFEVGGNNTLTLQDENGLHCILLRANLNPNSIHITYT